MNLSKINIIKYPFSILLSLITVGAIWWIYGFFWEEAQKYAAALLCGSIASPPYNVWFEDTLLFQIPVIAFLSDYFEKIPVYGIWNMLVIVLYLSLWFHLSIRILNRRIKNSPLFLILLSLLFVYSIIGICLVYIHDSQPAMLLTSGSLLIYLDYYLFERKKPIPFVLLFLYGCLLRVSSGILVLIAITLLFLLLFRNLKKTISLLKIHWVLAMLCLLTVQGNKYIANNPGLTYQGIYEYAGEDRHMLIPLSEMKTRPDSVRYTALTNYFFFSDTAQINIDFIKRIIDVKKYLNFGINREDITFLSESLLPLLNENKVVIILFYLLLIVAAWNCNKRTIANIIAINLFCWLVVIGLGMKLIIVSHFLLPWISIIFSSSFFLVSLSEERFSNRQTSIVVILLLIIVPVVSGNLNDIKKREIENNKRTCSYLKKLETLCKTAVPVLWDYTQSPQSFCYFTSEVLSRRQPDVLKNCLYQTMPVQMYYKFGQERCLKKFGFSPLDWRSMNISFHKNHEKVRFVMEQNPADFLGVYYKTLYNLDFKLVKDEPPNEIVPGNFVYHLEMDETSSK